MSSHLRDSPPTEKSTMSAHGTGHLHMEDDIFRAGGEMEVPGVEQVKRLSGGSLIRLPGVTVEKDALFQVGIIPSPLTFNYTS